MQIQDTLKEAIGLIQSDGKRYYWAGQFIDIQSKLMSAGYRDSTLQPIFQATSNITQDIWNVCTLVTRMEWFRNLAIQDRSLRDSFYWRTFTSLDIEHFHVELRSIFDYVAEILVAVAPQRGQVKKKSFDKLYHWLEKDSGNRARIGEEASELVLSASWYSELRGIRNDIIHRGAHTLVFGLPQDGILFQVHRGFKRLVKIEPLMWNKNVVDFQLYAGLYFAKTLEFLERLGEFLAARVAQEEPYPEGARAWASFDILRDWMSRLLTKLNLSRAQF